MNHGPDGRTDQDPANDVARDAAIADLLRASEERYRLLAEAASDVVWTMSVDGAITYVSPAVEQMRGVSQQEAMAQGLDEILTPESAAISLQYWVDLTAALDAGLPPPADFRAELDYLHADGSIVPTEVHAVPHFDDAGHLIEIIGVSRDISERRRIEGVAEQARAEARDALAALSQANAALERLAKVDPLTGIANRRRLDELVTAVAALCTPEYPAALVILDVDHFKDVNDRHGHHVGDQVLTELTRRVERALRARDVMGRWGGEEFAILLPGTSLATAAEIAERVRSTVGATPFPGVGTVTVSLGVAECHEGECAEAWMSRADDAMYQAKAGGRNRVYPAGA